MPFLVEDDLPFLPTMLAAIWSIRSLPSFPRRSKRDGSEFVGALVELHVPWPGVVAALARLRFGRSQPISVSAAYTHVPHRLWA